MSEKKTVTVPIICKGGLNTNQHHLELAQYTPGAAVELQNFEPSLFGGYRRINGYEPLVEDYPEVDPTGAEGKILGIAIFGNDIIVARKQQSGATYNFYYWTAGGDWTPFSTSLTLTSTGVDKIRYDTWNFDGTMKIGFVDGVNGLIIYDGTTWSQIVTDTGSEQALETPKYIKVYQNHVFVSGDEDYPQIVAHSAPNDESDWTSGNGAGQIVAGINVNQIFPFRDNLYVFSMIGIKKITVDSSGAFLINDVIKELGNMASDSVLEMNSDVIFLSQDGFRTIAGTDRIGDIEAACVSKNIQQDIFNLIENSLMEGIDSVVVRSKSQFRVFFSSGSIEPENTFGIITGLRQGNDAMMFEWGRLRGIRTSCATSGYIGRTEYVIHGDHDGCVYRQERGNNFNGQDILAIYTTPYLDFGDSQIRKTLRTINLFVRPEGSFNLSSRLTYDWKLSNVHNPDAYLLQNTEDGAIYGIAEYDSGSVYGSITSPVMVSNVEGSGSSVQIQLTNYGQESPFSIQGIVYEFSPADRK